MILEGELNISFNPRCFSGEDESEISKNDIETIRAISNLYKSNYIKWNGAEYQSTINWRYLVECIEESYDPNGRYYNEREGQIHKSVGMFNLKTGLSGMAQVVLPIIIKHKDTDKLNEHVDALMRLLTDIFFVANFSAPGVLNFYSACLKINGVENEYKRLRDEHDLSLSSYPFEQVVNSNKDKRHPYSNFIPVEKVKSWYDNLGIGLKLKSESEIERIIFSLLHICKLEYDIGLVPWIFHALESIYGTNAGRGYGDISDKAIYLLDIPERKIKKFKSRLRELNDLRCKFIHGGFKIHHPLDEEYEDNVLDLSDFGVTLIIESIQVLIHKGWIGIYEKKCM